MAGGKRGGAFQECSELLEEMAGLFIEGRVYDSAAPERVGVGLPRPTGRRGNGRLSAQRRHLTGKAYEVRGREEEICDETERTSTHGGFLSAAVKGYTVVVRID